MSLQEIKEEVRARTDIVDVVSIYTRLRKQGKRYSGLCPFHTEKNASFSVVPDMGVYRCFSCGEKGDVFTFVQKKENLTFVEALEWLARRAGVPFERRAVANEPPGEREEMLQLNLMTTRFYQEQLSRSQEGTEYLAGRGILRETQQEWELGYAPPGGALLGHFRRMGANIQLAAKLGLVKPREEGGYYDSFRRRIIFPIHDVGGRIVGFGGRALSSEDAAKYLNSDQSVLFDKSRLLYGLHRARREVSGATPPILVEGYLDVITAHQAGFRQCVATLGTSLTEEHARILSRYGPALTICYDSDAAGISATLRAAESWESLGLAGSLVRIMRLPAGDDPDSILMRGDQALFARALKDAAPRIDFQLELALNGHDLSSSEGREAALNAAVQILASIPELRVRARYASNLAHLHPRHAAIGAERATDEILADVRLAARAMGRKAGYPLSTAQNRAPLREQPGRRPAEESLPASSTASAAHQLSRAEKAELQLMRGLISPKHRVDLLARLSPEQLVTPHARRLFEWVARTPASEDGGVDIAPLLREAESGDAAASEPDCHGFSAFLRMLLEDSVFLVSNDLLTNVAIEDCLKRLRTHAAEQEQRSLAVKLLSAETDEERRALLVELHERSRALRGSGAA